MDQYNNSVDGEIRVPIKYGTKESGEWKPLGANSWLEQPPTGPITTVTYSGPKDGSQKPSADKVEYVIAFADGSIGDHIYRSEGEARLDLMEIRVILKGYGVPEEHHPILMSRDVITSHSSWKILSV